MLDSLTQGFWLLVDPKLLLYMVTATVAGLAFGIIPGLGGMTFLALMIPFVFGMEPLVALTVLLAGHAVVHTSGGITAILLNVPGTATNAPTLLDGFPMAQAGKAGRAIGNAVTASALGGVIGAIFLMAAMPLLRQVIRLFGSPELFFMVVLGITFIAILSTGSMFKGIITGALGIILSLVGLDQITATSRLSYGILYLDEGLHIVPLVLGLFAIPQVIDVMLTGESIAKTGAISSARSDLWTGVKDVFRHWSLTLRCSVIGVIVGAIPGIGGETAIWICYGHAKQTSRHPERFGYGSEEGIIAPEAANNSKEGGSLIPTLAFGVPGSAGMAVMMGAFLIVGIDPGPLFLKEHMDIAYAMIIVLAAANVLAAVLCFLFAHHMVKVTFIPANILVPFMLSVIVLGAYLYHGDFMDVVATFVIGAIGYGFVRFDFPRPPLILGFILGKLAELYLHISLKTVGPLFFLRPASFVIIMLTVLGILFAWQSSRNQKKRIA